MFFLYNFAGFNWTKQQVFLQPGSRWHLKCKAVRNKTLKTSTRVIALCLFKTYLLKLFYLWGVGVNQVYT